MTLTEGLIEKPIIEDGEVRKSLSTLEQASNIVSTLIASNNYRHVVNSRIRSKFDAERPYDKAKLEQEGLAWRSNFTTKPLAQMVEKIYPKYSEAVSGVKYLTDSQLPSDITNAKQKSEKFQKGITDLIRSEPTWDTLVDDIALDDVLFGHTVVAWLDEFSWFPDHFKQDEVFLTDGCKQDVETAQMICLKETYLPHELYDYIRDRKTAEKLGWDIENTIEAINGASAAQLQSQLGPASNVEFWYRNAERDLTVGSSYMAGASVIACYTILVQETNGKVSMFRLSDCNSKEGSKMKELYGKYDRFDSMAECASFFAFQKGNGNMHGSKGVGREVYELAAMQDRSRNEVVDRAIMSGKLFLQGDVRQIHKFRMNVIGAMCIIPNGWNVLEKSIDGKVQPFLQLDAYFAQLVDELVGSVSPRRFSGDRTTKAEVDVITAREEEMRDVKVSRWMRQFVKMIATMQKRICSKHVTDEKCKKFRKEMLKVMTEEEFEMLAEAPVARTIADLTPLERQATVAFVNEKRGHPLYNQRELESRDITARLGADEVDSLLLVENDPTQEAEQIRNQKIELVLLAQGHEMPVSRRDNHAIHLRVAIPEVEAIAAQVQQGSLPTESLERIAQHIQEHVQRATEDGMQAPEIAQAQALLEQLIPVIQKLKQVDQQAQQLTDPAMVQGGPPPQA